MCVVVMVISTACAVKTHRPGGIRTHDSGASRRGTRGPTPYSASRAPHARRDPLALLTRAGVRGCTTIASATSTNLLLSTGASLEVAGTLEDVEKLLQDAVRSSPGTLARLQDADSGVIVGVNPAQVVTVTRGR
jgi:hypothetical protein